MGLILWHRDQSDGQEHHFALERVILSVMDGRQRCEGHSQEILEGVDISHHQSRDVKLFSYSHPFCGKMRAAVATSCWHCIGQEPEIHGL